MRDTAAVSIGKNHQDLLKTLSDETKIPQRYLVENELNHYLENKYPEYYNLLKKKEKRHEKKS